MFSDDKFADSSDLSGMSSAESSECDDDIIFNRKMVCDKYDYKTMNQSEKKELLDQRYLEFSKVIAQISIKGLLDPFVE